MSDKIKVRFDDATVFIVQVAYTMGCQHGADGGIILDRAKIPAAVIAYAREMAKEAP